MGEFHWLRPWWLLALLPLAWLWWQTRQRQAGHNAWAGVCDPHLLPWLLAGNGGDGGRGVSWLLGLGWLLAVLALAGPTWAKRPQPVLERLDARVIVLDLSRSMLAEDLKPSRLERAKYKVRDLLERSREGQTALVAYAGDAFTVTPLTRDTDTIAALLPALEPGLMPAGGSRASRGLERAAELLEQAGLSSGEILLVTDGADAAATDTARELADRGIRSSVLAVATAEGAPIPGAGGFLRDRSGEIVLPRLDADGLAALARAGGGRFAVLRPDTADLELLLAEPSTPLAAHTRKSGRESDAWREEGPWLVVLLLPLAALAFRRGWLLVLALLLHPAPAPALDWDGLWLRPDQRAARELAAGRPGQALDLAQDPMLAGTAAYRAGDYARAAAAFARAGGADGHYNRGNALARQGELEQALAAYDAALALVPDMEDAIANRKAVEDLLKQQQPPPDSTQSGQDQDQPPSAGDSPQPQAGQGGDQGRDQTPGEQQPQAGNDGEAEQQPSQAGARTEPAAPPGQPPQEQPAPAEADPQGEPRDGPDRQTAAADQVQEQERQQMLEQWLRRIPDDPGGLLRRKFLLQYQRRGHHAGQSEEDNW